MRNIESRFYLDYTTDLRVIFNPVIWQIVEIARDFSNEATHPNIRPGAAYKSTCFYGLRYCPIYMHQSTVCFLCRTNNPQKSIDQKN